VPGLWNELTGRWALATPPPDAATALFLLQNAFGIWPADGVVTVVEAELLRAICAALHCPLPPQMDQAA